MEIVQRVSHMIAISKEAIRRNQAIGLVPTMGALHEGHLSLVRKGRSLTNPLVVSIFVNPAQFGKNEDFSRYPRDLDADAALLKLEGVDFVFAPAAEEMYMDPFATWVVVEGLSQRMCGVSRPDHFRGVTTVVTKLFNIVRPAVAFFGQKDAQQSVIVRRMVQDLNIDTEIVICPTVRDADGVAISSRNRYLNAEERRAATVLVSALRTAERMIAGGERTSRRIADAMIQLIQREPLAHVDYISITDGHSLQPVAEVAGAVLIALAVFIGKTRLIDNLMVSAAA